ncbi:hypothetical protein J5226_04170 [Lysobacter sp. K5869]|uniref:hypothetical protein n=1 Tax=Lysobacter sp. K5869 TaxID=2820808 RepID=UPI001C060791|nr:hypothetical protein [Lysobacter sp. K5869]QWP77613.1 hypothetical protein J5226_04170 [Lysobacter sp. K5869]
MGQDDPYGAAPRPVLDLVALDSKTRKAPFFGYFLWQDKESDPAACGRNALDWSLSSLVVALKAKPAAKSKWVPAFAGMTVGRVSATATCEKRSSHSVIPAKAGTHFDVASAFSSQERATTREDQTLRAFVRKRPSYFLLSARQKKVTKEKRWF